MKPVIAGVCLVLVFMYLRIKAVQNYAQGLYYSAMFLDGGVLRVMSRTNLAWYYFPSNPSNRLGLFCTSPLTTYSAGLHNA